VKHRNLCTSFVAVQESGPAEEAQDPEFTSGFWIAADAEEPRGAGRLVGT
jgi:hypothetical protein